MWTLRLRGCGRSAGFEAARVTSLSQIAARAQGLEIAALSQFAIRSHCPSGLILGFAGFTPGEIASRGGCARICVELNLSKSWFVDDKPKQFARERGRCKPLLCRKLLVKVISELVQKVIFKI
jgi:hypothetical protein